jgi:Ca2+-transporting ATPase
MFSSGIFANRGMWGAIVLTVLLQLGIIYIPFLQRILKTAFLEWNAMAVIVGVTLGFVLCIELLKYLSKRFKKS